MAREFRQVISSYSVPASLAVARLTISPASRQHHLLLTEALAQALAERAEAYGPASPQLCDHLVVYCGQEVLLEWHSAFLEPPILISHSVSQARVRAFARQMNATAKEGAA